MTIVAGPSSSSGNTSAALLVLGMPQQAFLRQDGRKVFTLTLPPDRPVGTLLFSATGLTGDDPDLYVSAGGTAHVDGACDEGATCWSSAQLGDDVLEIQGAAAEACRALALALTPTLTGTPTPTLTSTLALTLAPTPTLTPTRRAARPASGACWSRPTHTTPPSRCSPPCRAAWHRPASPRCSRGWHCARVHRTASTHSSVSTSRRSTPQRRWRSP